MQSNTFSSPDSKRTSTFTKTTNRKYFGSAANPEPDMKMSSILLNNACEEQTRLQGSKSPGLPVTAPIIPPNKPKPADNSTEKKEKSGGMYSSMIVRKSDEYQKVSGLASGDKIKELNNWADELKKKLSPLLNEDGKNAKPKVDLLSKYIVSNEGKESVGSGLTAFARVKKYDDKQTEHFKEVTDFSSFTNMLKSKKEAEGVSFSNIMKQA